MFRALWRRAPGRTLGVLALAVATAGFAIPNAAGVTGTDSAVQGSDASGGASDDDDGKRVLTGVIRVERDFTVDPHSLAINQLLPCPSGTQLVGGGTSLIGQPSSPASAPVIYTNGPVGDILPDNEQSWASEVANDSDESFTYRQFALCVQSKSKHRD